MPAQATPIATEVLSNLSNVATSATRPTLGARLDDLDSAVIDLDRLVESIGNRLQPILAAEAPTVSGFAGVDTDGDSDAVAWVVRTTERLHEITSVLARIGERVQL